MPKTRPFTKKSLREYPAFTELPPEVQQYALNLFDNDKLNHTGNFKRAPNSFITFRRIRAAQIIAERDATDNSDSHSSVLPQVKDEWDQMSDQQKMQYESAADKAEDELYEQFRYYKYQPHQNVWWDALTDEGKKRFFFESMVKICNNIVYNAPWTSYITAQEWSQRGAHLNAGYVDAEKLLEAQQKGSQPVATTRPVTQGSRSEPVLQSAPALSLVSPNPSATNNRLPIIPVQGALSSGIPSANHSNYVSENLHTYETNSSSALPDVAWSAQPLYGHMPIMNSNPTNTTYAPDIALGNLPQAHSTSLATGQQIQTLDTHSEEFQFDAHDLSWLSDLGPPQNDSDFGPFDLQSILPTNFNYVVSEEETKVVLEYFDRTFREMGVSDTMLS